MTGQAPDDRLSFDWRPPVANDASDPGAWHADQTLAAHYVLQVQNFAASGRGDLFAVWFQYGREGDSDRIPKIFSATRP